MTDFRLSLFVLATATLLAVSCQNSVPPVEQPAESEQAAKASPAESSKPTGLLITQPDPAQFPHLHNLFQVTSEIYSGGEPEDAAAFEELQRLGIKTIVSVDGATPSVELAAKYGLTYVHIPIGYDGVPPEACAGLTRVVKDQPQPIYVHCHHGKHRGPAAVAIAAIAAGATEGTGALQILKVAGTGENYRGLWHDVEHFVPLPADTPLPELTSVAKVNSLAVAMAQIGRANDHLKLLASHQWQTSAEHPDLVPVAEATVLAEGFHEAVRLLAADRPAELKGELEASEQLAKELLKRIETEPDMAEAVFKSLQQSCQSCHATYRDQ
ncbi:hypothetical protein GC163_16370 [bacterium]|nr:hypothetical protein [bacterium]